MSRPWCVALLVAVANTAAAQAFPPVGPEFQVDVPAAANQFDPAISAESDRGYVVVWRSGTSILGRRFDAGGAPLGAEFTANVLPVSAGAPAVAARAEGGFLVAWVAPDGDGDGIFARRFDAGGQPVGGEIAVNSVITGRQSRLRVAAGEAGVCRPVDHRSGLQPAAVRLRAIECPAVRRQRDSDPRDRHREPLSTPTSS